jgi:hypothetical protein
LIRLVGRTPGVNAGDIAGSLRKDGYWGISINNRPYLAHRVIWAIMTGEFPPPSMQIDHISGNKADNRWQNLRLATQSNNQANATAKASNTSGFKGVTWYKRKSKWRAQIGHQGRRIILGTFDDPAEAHQAYVAKSRELYGEFSNSGTVPAG